MTKSTPKPRKLTSVQRRVLQSIADGRVRYDRSIVKYYERHVGENFERDGIIGVVQRLRERGYITLHPMQLTDAGRAVLV